MAVRGGPARAHGEAEGPAAGARALPVGERAAAGRERGGGAALARRRPQPETHRPGARRGTAPGRRSSRASEDRGEKVTLATAGACPGRVGVRASVGAAARTVRAGSEDEPSENAR